jgi:Mn2+/Fe2+ NRAMP family transporter
MLTQEREVDFLFEVLHPLTLLFLYDYFLQMLNVAQSLLLPFALLPALHMTANKEVMGEKFVSARYATS